jgi:polyvinyl alcohol dehydrogenase (cytochrome)
MSRKFVLIIYYLVPFAVFGQAAITPYYQVAQSAPVGLMFNPEYNVGIPGRAHVPAAWQEEFRQPVHSEPLSLTSMILRHDNKMGASATGGVIYTGSDDVFAYAHYGRTGKLIWRTSPIANNMMATRWSLANFSIFQRAALPSISDQMR